jgi:iron complex outermembrane recepter protein
VSGTVVVKGTTTHAVSDVDGQFKLTTDRKLPFTLVISSVGYKPQELEVYELFDEPVDIILIEDNVMSEIVVTARRRSETVQEVPIPISVISGPRVEEAGAFNVNRLKELVPSVQLYSSNPRNTGINIRGLGSPFGLTNDGLDPGVGFYVDGVYFARPAAATLDFIDIERIEVLRGPQGTLFGKNTTAGAFNITTRKPSFTPGADLEVSYGNYGYIQAKTSLTGPIVKDKLAARFSFSGTQRDGTIYNVAKDEYVNDMNNLGFRGQLLFTPNDKISIVLSGDDSRQNPNGYAQVVAGVVETQRPAYRQFNTIIADLNYSLPTLNPFDRVIDHDTPWRSLNELGGVALNAEIEIGNGTLTSTTAWRYWNWGPSNDRDFTGLQSLTKSQNPSEHRNWSQEIRYAGEFSKRISGVIGFFFMDQEVTTNGTEESGSAQWRFSQSSTSELWKTPGLLDGYGARTRSSIESRSAAVFGNLDWSITDRLHLLPGIRYNYDKKDVSYNRETYGGLQTNDPDLIAIKNTVYRDQFFVADAEETNLTYQITLAYRTKKRLNGYATYSASYKPVGVNVAGLPVINGEVAVELGTIKPEYVKHIEAGLKSTPTRNLVLNLTFFNTDITDYQTNVQSPQLGVNRGYIANAEKVNVKGAEFDGSIKVNKNISFYGALSYTDAKYVTFTNAPLPLEETGATSEGVQVAFKDISGERLPGVSKWSGSLTAEVTSNKILFLDQQAQAFIAFDTFFRSEFSSSSSPSKYLNIDGYGLLNARLGFRATKGLSLTLWARNLLNENYFEQLLAAGGNAGHYAGVLGDPRTYGVTVRYGFGK